MIGRTIGSYTIVEKLGSGGMGEVYLAEHRRIARRAAIKFLLPSLSRDADVVSRFFNEARATSIIKHPGIVEVYDCDVIDERAYIIMEFLEGESLGSALARVGNFAGEIASVASVAGQIAGALSAAHGKGIIHRDLKPENVFLALDDGSDGNFVVKILDFGIAKLASDNAVGSGSNTRTGSVLGTPTYMSPEQCRGLSTVDHRADVYALGCIIFEMLTGRHVFVKEAPGDLLVAHIHEPAPRVSFYNPTVPPVLDDLVARMLSKAPADRPGSMAEVVAELEQLLGTPAVEFARKIPVTSTMIGGPPTRPRPKLPSSPPLPTPPRTPPPPALEKLPSAVAGGTRVLSQKGGPPAKNAQESSTFRHTASELLTAPPESLRPSRKGWVVGGLLVVGAGVAAAVVLTQPDHGGGRAVTETSAARSIAPAGAARPDPPRRGVETPPEAAEETPPPAATPPRPTESTRATIRIESKPSGAALWIDGEPRPRGETPLDLALPRNSSPRDAVLKAPGYADAKLVLDPTRTRPLKVELEKEKRQDTKSPRHASRPTPKQESDRKPAKPADHPPPAKPADSYFGVGD
jgi:serine/threonine-protein kinase